MSSSTSVPDNALNKAVAFLQTGRHTQARQLLLENLSLHPDCAEAYRLLAASYFETREFARARRALQAGISLDPREPESHVLLGRVLTAAGHVGEAERALRHALQLNPDHLIAASALARVLLMQHRADEAYRLLEPRISKDIAKTASELLMLCGHALMLLERPGDAVPVFRELARRDPGNSDVRLRLAAALADSEQPVEAEVEARAAAAQRHSPEAAFVLARALCGQERMTEAEPCLRQVVHARPDHVTAQGNLSELVWMRTGNLLEASEELDRALHLRPNLSALRVIKARLLLSAQQQEQALATLEEGLAVARTDLGLLNAASVIALEFDAQRALEFARRALRISPQNRSALVAFGNASLGVGFAEQAQSTAEKLRSFDPHDGQSIAMQADAWRMLGDERYHALLDYRNFVRADLVDVPDGWASLSDYLADLRSALEGLHTHRAHPIGQSLRQGTQIELAPERSVDPAIRAFPKAIDPPLRGYLEAVGTGSDPLRSRNNGRYRLRGAWSVRLRPQGFHVSHYHPQGWLSSACYIHLPPAVDEHHGEGWLQFGEPAFPTQPRLQAEYFLKPEPGLLALFPAYMWHGTRPFTGSPDQSRLTVAFDVVPA